MKLVCSIVFLALLASCGEPVEFRPLENNFVTIDDFNAYQVQVQLKFDRIDDNLNDIQVLIEDISDTNATQTGLITDLIDLNNDLENRLDNLSEDVRTDIEDLQQVSSLMQSEIDILESQGMELVKPCINSDEVFFKLNSGGFVSYFESGDRRYLSILEVGSYITTDNSSCSFRIVDNNGTLEIQ